MENDPDNICGGENPLRGLICGCAIVALVCSIVACRYATGCASMPDLPAGAYDFVTNAVQRALVEPAEAAASDESEPAGTEPGRQDSERLVFRYGGFQGGNAVEDPATQIADVKMSKSGLSYRWAKGGCENFGAKDRGDCDHTLACAFFWSEKEQAWIGGKFDWISTSRTTRDFKNLDGDYGGWDAGAFWGAPRRAFCIASR